MKKTALVVLVIALVGVLASACLPNPRVPIECNGKTIKVKLVDAQAYKEVCGTEAPKQVALQPECQPATVVAKVVPATVVVEQPVVVTNVTTAPTCSYDYNVMPIGVDEKGIPFADYGVQYSGSIIGPAMVQLDSLTVVSIFPGEIYNVPTGDIVTWKYIGDEACLRSQYEWFPGKNIILTAK